MAAPHSCVSIAPPYGEMNMARTASLPLGHKPLHSPFLMLLTGSPPYDKAQPSKVSHSASGSLTTGRSFRHLFAPGWALIYEPILGGGKGKMRNARIEVVSYWPVSNSPPPRP